MKTLCLIDKIIPISLTKSHQQSQPVDMGEGQNENSEPDQKNIRTEAERTTSSMAHNYSDFRSLIWQLILKANTSGCTDDVSGKLAECIFSTEDRLKRQRSQRNAVALMGLLGGCPLDPKHVSDSSVIQFCLHCLLVDPLAHIELRTHEPPRAALGAVIAFAKSAAPQMRAWVDNATSPPSEAESARWLLERLQADVELQIAVAGWPMLQLLQGPQQDASCGRDEAAFALAAARQLVSGPFSGTFTCQWPTFLWPNISISQRCSEQYHSQNHSIMSLVPERAYIQT